MISPFVKAYVYIDAWKHKKRIDRISDTLIKELIPFDYWKGKIRYSWFWSAAIQKYITGDDSKIFDSFRYRPNILCYRRVLEALM